MCGAIKKDAAAITYHSLALFIRIIYPARAQTKLGEKKYNKSGAVEEYEQTCELPGVCSAFMYDPQGD
jgi:hypothetical protein